MKSLSLKLVVIVTMFLALGIGVAEAQSKQKRPESRRPTAKLYDSKTIIGIPINGTFEEIRSAVMKFSGVLEGCDTEGDYWQIEETDYRGTKISGVEVQSYPVDGSLGSVYFTIRYKDKTEADKKLDGMIRSISKYVTMSKNSSEYIGKYTDAQGSHTITISRTGATTVFVDLRRDYVEIIM